MCMRYVASQTTGGLFYLLGVMQMAIQRTLGMCGSGVRISPPRRHGDAIAYRNVHRIGVVDKRGKTRPLAHGAMVAQFAHNERAVGSSPAGPTYGGYSVVVTRLFVKQLSTVRNCLITQCPYLSNGRTSLFHGEDPGSIPGGGTNCPVV